MKIREAPKYMRAYLRFKTRVKKFRHFPVVRLEDGRIGRLSFYGKDSVVGTIATNTHTVYWTGERVFELADEEFLAWRLT